MSLRLRVDDEASAELEDAARWYERRHAGLGLELLAAVDRAIDHLVEWPDAGSPVVGLPPDLLVRQVPVPRFPYHVVYLVVSDAIHLLAFAHDRRRPGYWRTRGHS